MIVRGPSHHRNNLSNSKTLICISSSVVHSSGALITGHYPEHSLGKKLKNGSWVKVIVE